MKDHAKIYAGLLIGLMMWWAIGTASFYMTVTMMHDESGIIHRAFRFYLIQNICFIVSGIVTLLLRRSDATVGRVVTRVYNILLLIQLPLGTALGIYGLWKIDRRANLTDQKDH